MVETIKSVRASFLAGLGARLERLDALMDRSEEAPGEVLPRIEEEAHRIRGLAASIDYDDLGRLASDAEDALRSHSAARPGQRLGEDARRHVEDFLDEMDRILTARG
ncbi:Hpt domain-containing protein [Roseicyclus sp. F158]|uniref:Hpt domain-containing protein n=1 Tax=Tropicimonas omnivorans TaxID=3075590 RepID=A0ABU3DGM6_9RHOB|nr:Hpt domain-containing protein [Roseicyclus sp. F158]MDT0682871.1 Hpt domain-containing protein [Roseicyclus sp. F158]